MICCFMGLSWYGGKAQRNIRQFCDVGLVFNGNNVIKQVYGLRYGERNGALRLRHSI